MAVSAIHLQGAYTTTSRAQQATTTLLQGDRTPSWARALSGARQATTVNAELAAAADTLASDVVAGEPFAATIAKTNDYLRGAAWHSRQGVATLERGVADALSGHAELASFASRIMDPSAHLVAPTDITAFETMAKHIDPSLLNRIGEALRPASGSLERALADLTSARGVLRSIAAVTPH